jgi:Ca2+-binding EF-hand superfamily protein
MKKIEVLFKTITIDNEEYISIPELLKLLSKVKDCHENPDINIAFGELITMLVSCYTQNKLKYKP